MRGKKTRDERPNVTLRRIPVRVRSVGFFQGLADPYNQQTLVPLRIVVRQGQSSNLSSASRVFARVVAFACFRVDNCGVQAHLVQHEGNRRVEAEPTVFAAERQPRGPCKKENGVHRCAFARAYQVGNRVHGL
jgi:hypothetical protein